MALLSQVVFDLPRLVIPGMMQLYRVRTIEKRYWWNVHIIRGSFKVALCCVLVYYQCTTVLYSRHRVTICYLRLFSLWLLFGYFLWRATSQRELYWLKRYVFVYVDLLYFCCIFAVYCLPYSGMW